MGLAKPQRQPRHQREPGVEPTITRWLGNWEGQPLTTWVIKPLSAQSSGAGWGSGVGMILLIHSISLGVVLGGTNAGVVSWCIWMRAERLRRPYCHQHRHVEQAALIWVISNRPQPASPFPFCQPGKQPPSSLPPPYPPTISNHIPPPLQHPILRLTFVTRASQLPRPLTHTPLLPLYRRKIPHHPCVHHTSRGLRV